MNKKLIDLEIKNINDEIEKNTTVHEKIAIFFSKKIGSMFFIYFLLLFMLMWVSINIALLLSGKNPFDKPYDFTIMLLISNSIQLLTPLFLLVSQNIQDKRDKALADQEYLVSKRSENATNETLEYLQNISDKFTTLFTKLDTQQQTIISLEEIQNNVNANISGNLTSILKDAVSQMNHRPCLLDQAGYEQELCDTLINAIKRYKEKHRVENNE